MSSITGVNYGSLGRIGMIPFSCAMPSLFPSRCFQAMKYCELHLNTSMVGYKALGEYSKAVASYKTTIEILGKNSPSNHPSMATSYNNISRVYSSMREYLQVLRAFTEVHYLRIIRILKLRKEISTM